jgi:anti-sigma factor RsiW
LSGVANPPADREGSGCGSIARLLGAHTDGQLDAARTLELDDHLGECETCRERVALDRAIRGSLKKAVKTAAPPDVRARMLAAMAGQSARDAVGPAGVAGRDKPRSRTPMLRHWRTMIPLASAAAVAMAWGFAGGQPLASADGTSRLGAGFSNDDLVNQLVDVHSRPIHPETSDPSAVRAFEREVGVPVHVPRPQKNARFVGARLLPVQGGERAAMLEYEVAQANGGVERVSLFIFDPRRVQIRSADQFAPRAVGSSQVRVGQARGYSFAVAQRGGVGYAVASDLEDSSAEFVAAADAE